MAQAQKMKQALNKYVVPQLTNDGFIGEYPHFKKIYSDRIELLSFFNNKYGCSFNAEVSVVYPGKKGEHSNFIDGEIDIDKIDVFCTNDRYRLKGMYDGWFYYTDVYKSDINGIISYDGIGETKAGTYTPKCFETLVQKADINIYKRVCDEVNAQLKDAYKWWEKKQKKNNHRLF